MKTFWLQGREARTPLHRPPDLPEPDFADSIIDASADPTEVQVRSNAEDRKSVAYSPITFQDVARRSIASSPVKGSKIALSY